MDGYGFWQMIFWCVGASLKNWCLQITEVAYSQPETRYFYLNVGKWRWVSLAPKNHSLRQVKLYEQEEKEIRLQHVWQKVHWFVKLFPKKRFNVIFVYWTVRLFFSFFFPSGVCLKPVWSGTSNYICPQDMDKNMAVSLHTKLPVSCIQIWKRKTIAFSRCRWAKLKTWKLQEKHV